MAISMNLPENSQNVMAMSAVCQAIQPFAEAITAADH